VFRAGPSSKNVGGGTMTKNKIMLYKPSGGVKEYNDITIINKDHQIRVLNIGNPGDVTISYGQIEFRNNDRDEIIASTLPYTCVTYQIKERKPRIAS
jgi:hypothetical protein